jgi:hypothetical protein
MREVIAVVELCEQENARNERDEEENEERSPRKREPTSYARERLSRAGRLGARVASGG